MLLPGIKKVRDYFNFTDDGKVVSGILQNSRIRLCDGVNCKILYITAPAPLNDETKEALNKFTQSPYRAKVEFNTQSVTFTFREIFAPYSWKKICDIITETAKIFYNANPGLQAPKQEDEAQLTNLNTQSQNVGRFYRTIFLLVLAFLLPLAFKEYKQIEFTKQAAKEISQDCPSQIDDITRLDSASSSWNKLFMNFTFTEEVEVSDELEQTIKENFITNLKENGIDEVFYANMTWFILQYHDLEGKALFEIKIFPINYKPEGAK